MTMNSWILQSSLVFLVTFLIIIVDIPSSHSIDRTCINKDSTNFLNGPYKKPILNLPKNSQWENDDWLTRVASDFALGPVLDERWIDFPVLNETCQTFNRTNAISFSIYSEAYSTEIAVYVNDRKYYADDFIYEQINKNQWHNYTIVTAGDVLTVVKDDEILKSFNDTLPEEIVVKSNTTVSWKIHEYKFKWSDKLADKPTILNIPQNQTSCLVVYAALCATCSLNITLKTDTDEEPLQTIKSKDSRVNSYDQWNWRHFEVQPDKETKVTISRVEKNDEKRHWAFDVRLYAENIDCAKRKQPDDTREENEQRGHSFGHSLPISLLLVVSTYLISTVVGYWNQMN